MTENAPAPVDRTRALPGQKKLNDINDLEKPGRRLTNSHGANTWEVNDINALGGVSEASGARFSFLYTILLYFLKNRRGRSPFSLSSPLQLDQCLAGESNLMSLTSHYAQ